MNARFTPALHAACRLLVVGEGVIAQLYPSVLVVMCPMKPAITKSPGTPTNADTLTISSQHDVLVQLAPLKWRIAGIGALYGSNAKMLLGPRTTTRKALIASLISLLGGSASGVQPASLTLAISRPCSTTAMAVFDAAMPVSCWDSYIAAGVPRPPLV